MLRFGKFICFFLFLNVGFLFSQNGNQDSLSTLDFIYDGENPYFQNPALSNGHGFCTTHIEVNGMTDSAGINSPAFEIALKDFKFSFNDSIHLIIHHHSGCQPKLLNPECLNTHSEAFEGIRLDTTGMLHFIPNENKNSGRSSVIIQQYRWNKWVAIGTPVFLIQANPEQEYKIDVNKFLCNGINWFRIVVPLSGQEVGSSMIGYYAGFERSPVVFDSQSQCNKIYFSDSTQWELYDSNGKFQLKGFGNEIDYSFLSEQNQFTVNYDDLSIQVKANRCTNENPEQQKKKNLPIILVYPNANSNEFTISTGQEFFGCALHVEVFDLSGRSILAGEIQGGSAFQISMDDFSSGIYFLRLSHGKETICNRKIMVHH